MPLYSPLYKTGRTGTRTARAYFDMEFGSSSVNDGTNNYTINAYGTYSVWLLESDPWSHLYIEKVGNVVNISLGTLTSSITIPTNTIIRLTGYAELSIPVTEMLQCIYRDPSDPNETQDFKILHIDDYVLQDNITYTLHIDGHQDQSTTHYHDLLMVDYKIYVEHFDQHIVVSTRAGSGSYSGGYSFSGTYDNINVIYLEPHSHSAHNDDLYGYADVSATIDEYGNITLSATAVRTGGGGLGGLSLAPQSIPTVDAHSYALYSGYGYVPYTVNEEVLSLALDTVNTDVETITINGQQVNHTGRQTYSYDVKRYEGYLELNTPTQNWTFSHTAETSIFKPADDYKIHTYRFIAIDSSSFVWDNDLGIVDITKWQGDVSAGGGYIQFLGGTATANVQKYADAYRYLKLILSDYSNLNLTIQMNNKQYTLVDNSNVTAPKAHYVDLCTPSNATQQVDPKVDNFDNDDSYSDYWGITKINTMVFTSSNSFKILGASLYTLQSYTYQSRERNKITTAPSKYIKTLPNGEKARPFIVSRIAGKQALELSDIVGTDSYGNYQYRTINQLVDKWNTERYWGWSVVKHVYDLSVCNVQYPDLRPCFLNLDVEAVHLLGRGVLFKNGDAEIHVNRDLLNDIGNVSLEAQYLVDTVRPHPFFGDGFEYYNTPPQSNTVYIKTAKIVKSNSNGLVVGSPQDTPVQIINYGQDATDGLMFYYTSTPYVPAISATTRAGVPPNDTSYTRQHYDATEMRLCFGIAAPPLSGNNDIAFFFNRMYSAHQIGEDKFYANMFDLNTLLNTTLNVKVQSVDASASGIFYIGDVVKYYDGGLKGFTDIQVGRQGYEVKPFIRFNSGKFYVSYYNKLTHNFNFVVYSSSFDIETSVQNIAPTDRDIEEQSFAFDFFASNICGVYVCKTGSTYYIRHLISADSGRTWRLANEVQL